MKRALGSPGGRRGRGGFRQAQGEEEGSKEAGAAAQALRREGAPGAGRTQVLGAGEQAGARGWHEAGRSAPGTRPGGQTSLTVAQMVSLAAARMHLK